MTGEAIFVALPGEFLSGNKAYVKSSQTIGLMSDSVSAIGNK